MEVNKEKSRLKAAEFEMKVIREDEILDLRTMGTNVIIKQLEANIKMRDMPIEKKLRKKFEMME